MAPITVHIKCANAKKYTVTLESDLKVPDLKVSKKREQKEGWDGWGLGGSAGWCVHGSMPKGIRGTGRFSKSRGGRGGGGGGMGDRGS